jgi:hypothetical protein
MVDPISVTAMVTGIICAVMACKKMFRKLWLKIKGMFSSGIVFAINIFDEDLLIPRRQKMPYAWYHAIP